MENSLGLIGGEKTALNIHKKEFVKTIETMGCTFLLLATAFIIVLPTASAYESINNNCWYHFTTADGGMDSAYTLFSDGRYTLSTKRVEAYSTTIGVGYGATGWAEVWKTVQCTQSGYFDTYMQGNYWVVMSAAGAATANIEFQLRIRDLSTGAIQASTMIYSRSVSYLDATNIQSDFYKYLLWYGTSGHQYGLELYAKAWSTGVVGSAIVDAAGDGSYFAGSQGAYYNYVEIGSHSTGGGGCVSQNAIIMTGNHLVKMAKNLQPGDSIKSYDLTTGSIIDEIVISNERTQVDLVEVINDGLLVVTPWDQPIYARNDTYTGWVRDPLNLTIGWQIFSPLLQTWVTIRNIEYEFGTFWVQEIKTTGPDNFIANGLLLDSKTP